MLIGIVKKNGIMMIDVALVLRREGAELLEAIRRLMRFRPIMMTTAVAAAMACSRWCSAPVPAPSCAVRSASPSSAA